MAEGIYVASRVHHAQMWKRLRLEYPIVSTWIDEAGPGETKDFDDLWERIRKEIASARAFVLYAVAQDFPLKGALIEAGMAVALEKPVYVALEGVELEPRSMRPIGSWVLHSLVRRFESLDDALGAAFRCPCSFPHPPHDYCDGNPKGKPLGSEFPK